jgi:putative YhdH/YhfP family quinone oxidoreductase
MLGIDIFGRAGYEVHAISGKPEQFDFLRELGASRCLDRRELEAGGKPLRSARFGGALDNVGGAALAALLPCVAPLGNVAACGNAGGIALESTVMPFIIRGVSLLGIASAGTPRALREEVWRRLAGTWKPRHLDRIVTRVAALDELPAVFESMLAGRSFGRTLVRIGAEA